MYPPKNYCSKKNVKLKKLGTSFQGKKYFKEQLRNYMYLIVKQKAKCKKQNAKSK